MIEFNPQKIEGKWQFGIALDFHTTGSIPLGNNEFGHMQFDTIRPAIAERLYRLKYRGDQSAALDIVSAAVEFLRPHRAKLDILVPVPPSNFRSVQPVLLLANGIGNAMALTVAECIEMNRPATQLKSERDPVKRKEILDGLFKVDPGVTAGKNILLFDDVYRSGATLNAITEVLFLQGAAASVRALTVTRTRRNR